MNTNMENETEKQMPVGSDALFSSIKDESFFDYLCSFPQGIVDVEYVAKMAIRYIKRKGDAGTLKEVTNYSLNAERTCSKENVEVSHRDRERPLTAPTT